MTYYRHDSNKLYREHDGMFLGVFQGLANWSGLPAWALRIIGLILLFSVGFFKVAALYLLAAVLMPPRY
ncbi:putative stress-responsive transcriptional regulator [Sphaerochaeta pleomorpha str. Grapes]|uniref:Putative stress-responsive transcriptional regulator n=1 Tax=Sphaerochaeta pleomorpha (strain ATCC BAA-1885 / DSM 22778 / Grapes) TaxID=158190 RepID=G8QQZ1_SPHPG|nr:PspC domain-containing protein [Sphaerochaeta pleomorpha]AEV29833.1 putative stress-responsive transcriptional regulator [Sphaerochaeta pleomorpha str. Grapes]AEV29839.1 putative stress-responsive transcriptional regulator [Sphaerochaeta pleomorpha str. Grapes]